MISCEGTRFTEAKRIASMKIAQEKGLPELKHHILPRTKGFTLLLQGSENRSKNESFLRQFFSFVCSQCCLWYHSWFQEDWSETYFAKYIERTCLSSWNVYSVCLNMKTLVFFHTWTDVDAFQHRKFQLIPKEQIFGFMIYIVRKTLFLIILWSMALSRDILCRQ